MSVSRRGTEVHGPIAEGNRLKVTVTLGTSSDPQRLSAFESAPAPSYGPQIYPKRLGKALPH